ncbi:MAG TPA: DUF3343 domain-containing protein [Syntrophales bacterium]|jgi:hypothetical protein|nr:DUF3343 domain-containing protein [Syntrophales bacterium]HOU78605.1 DUF3343 domain-containing protein [Syntrophales bacterium]HPC33561.1 DUF3343 domain-containing protein [Syntrophales bacterium]HQG35298.1 DUF3343 domain-containing protein [Syntrophales bacterium]HQI35809.1 DUF3343 domain-containing protein [Syntrophales bacterium]
MKRDDYLVFLFPSVSHALKAEKILRTAGIDHKLIPVPRHISSDCGVCLRLAPGQRDAVAKLLKGRVDWEAEAPLSPQG